MPTIKEDVEAVQKIVSDSIKRKTTKDTSLKDNVFKEIISYNKDVIDFSLGKLGLYLKQFADVVDLEHPCLVDMPYDMFLKGGKLYDDIIESLKIGQFCKNEGLNKIISQNKGKLNSENEEVQKYLRKPPPRALKDKNYLEKVRGQKKTFLDVDVWQLYYNNRQKFDTMSDSFLPFARHGQGFKDKIEKNRQYIKNLDRVGLDNQISLLEQEIRELEEYVKDTYYDFIKIPSVNCAVILSKLLNVNKSLYGNSFTIARSNFKTDFSKNTKYDGNEYYTYSPRIYSLGKCPFQFSDNMKDILNSLENHPDCNNKPLFDFYWLLVPGIKCPSIDSDKYGFYDGEKKQEFSNLDDANVALDTLLVNNKDVFPVLLGENIFNQKSCFISYFV